MKKFLLIVLLLLCGCQSNNSKELSIQENDINSNIISSENISENNFNKEEKDQNKVVENPITNEDTIQENNTTEDIATEEEVVDYFEKSKNTIVSKLDSDTWDNVKNSVKDLFQKLYGFCFKGEEIKGYTLSDLTTSAKEKVLRVFKELDEIIESKYPNYKDDFKDSYENMKDSAKTGLGIVKDTIKKIFSK